ncbi:AarF/ABC1/UbiB kinase family protein [bacterium]|nr:AarF/ABC1/UbiB kinase family protein [bacterium]
MLNSIRVIERTYLHAQRYRQILAVLFKYGFDDLVERLNLESYVEKGLKLIARGDQSEAIQKATSAERTRMAIEELGPTFIKLGQILSTHPDILSEEIVVEFEKLQDHVPAFSFDEVRKIVEEDLGESIESVYDDFQETPIAAASIGQVHRAKLKDGKEVVVKVQRPGIKRIVETDLDILFHLAELAERHMEGMEAHNPSKVIEDFSQTIHNELDFTTEAANMEAFLGEFRHEEGVYVPTVYHDLTSPRVLTMEFVRGIKPSNIEELRKADFDPNQIAHRGYKYMIQQILVFGFFHADPHPANHLVMSDGTICYLDFGMMGHLSRREREEFADLVTAIAKRDEVLAAKSFVRLSNWDTEPDREKLEKALEHFMNQHFHKSLKKMELGRLLRELVEILGDFRMRLPQDLLLVVKALSTVEGLGRMLNPEFDPIAEAEPMLRRLQRARKHPLRVAQDTMDATGEMLHFLRELPGQMRTFFSAIRRGRLDIKFEPTGLEPLLTMLDKVSSRLSLAILVGSLVIGSSVIVLSGVPPTWHDIPLIGIVGFVVTGFLSLWLIVSIIRQSKP